MAAGAEGAPAFPAAGPVAPQLALHIRKAKLKEKKGDFFVRAHIEGSPPLQTHEISTKLRTVASGTVEWNEALCIPFTGQAEKEWNLRIEICRQRSSGVGKALGCVDVSLGSLTPWHTYNMELGVDGSATLHLSMTIESEEADYRVQHVVCLSDLYLHCSSREAEGRRLLAVIDCITSKAADDVMSEIPKIKQRGALPLCSCSVDSKRKKKNGAALVTVDAAAEGHRRYDLISEDISEDGSKVKFLWPAELRFALGKLVKDVLMTGSAGKHYPESLYRESKNGKVKAGCAFLVSLFETKKQPESLVAYALLKAPDHIDGCEDLACSKVLDSSGNVISGWTVGAIMKALGPPPPTPRSSVSEAKEVTCADAVDADAKSEGSGSHQPEEGKSRRRSSKSHSHRRKKSAEDVASEAAVATAIVNSDPKSIAAAKEKSEANPLTAAQDATAVEVQSTLDTTSGEVEVALENQLDQKSDSQDKRPSTSNPGEVAEGDTGDGNLDADGAVPNELGADATLIADDAAPPCAASKHSSGSLSGTAGSKRADSVAKDGDEEPSSRDPDDSKLTNEHDPLDLLLSHDEVVNGSVQVIPAGAGKQSADKGSEPSPRLQQASPSGFVATNEKLSAEVREKSELLQRCGTEIIKVRRLLQEAEAERDCAVGKLKRARAIESKREMKAHQLVESAIQCTVSKQPNRAVPAVGGEVGETLHALARRCVNLETQLQLTAREAGELHEVIADMKDSVEGAKGLVAENKRLRGVAKKQAAYVRHHQGLQSKNDSFRAVIHVQERVITRLEEVLEDQLGPNFMDEQRSEPVKNQFGREAQKELQRVLDENAELRRQLWANQMGGGRLASDEVGTPGRADMDSQLEAYRGEIEGKDTKLEVLEEQMLANAQSAQEEISRLRVQVMELEMQLEEYTGTAGSSDNSMWGQQGLTPAIKGPDAAANFSLDADAANVFM